MGRITYGEWPHPASAYISGISVGILVRSPFLWPYFLTSLISITSKYVLRVSGRHLWNPIELRRQRRAVPRAGDGHAAQHPVGQRRRADGGHLAARLGDRLARRPRCTSPPPTSRRSCCSRSCAALITGTPWLANVAPITGPMYQLFIFFMVTDPKTTVRSKSGQCVVVFLVAFVEMVLRLNEVVYAPFYALFLVGPHRDAGGDLAGGIRLGNQVQGWAKRASEAGCSS